jgi:hypothetical protein
MARGSRAGDGVEALKPWVDLPTKPRSLRRRRSSTPADWRCALLDARQTFAEVREAAFNGDETDLDAVETSGKVFAKVIDPLIDAVNRAPVHPCRDKNRQHDGECDLGELTVYDRRIQIISLSVFQILL